MSSEFSLESWNDCVLAIVQSLLGAISPNFRMVALSAHEDTWIIRFVLEKDSTKDREEIEDIASEFEANHDSPVLYKIETIITPATLDWPAPPTRVIFRRRE
jgi:hypothetical protein